MGNYGIIFNLALGHTGHGNRYVREPDFWDHPRRQERRCHPCSRINVGTCIWVDLFLCGKTDAKMIFPFMALIAAAANECRGSFWGKAATPVAG